MRRVRFLLCLFVLLPASQAFSSVALLLEEPFARFGFVNPTGHAAVYLSNVCAESPTQLRRCMPGETGVVISRYHRVAGRDWLAIPLIPYLYAVDRATEIPTTANLETEAELRDAWRRKHLESLVPDAKDGQAPKGDWIQLVGSLYDRKIFVFEVGTTEEQDEAFIKTFNRRSNRSHFNLLFNNCADFARKVLDFYFPHAVHRSYSADLGITTPKQIAKSLVSYSARHEQLEMGEFVLPQVAGSIPRSKHVDGVVEALLRKKYVVPIAILHPYVAAGLALTYFTDGRFDPSKHAVTLDRNDMIQAMRTDQPLAWHSEPGLSRPGLSESGLSESGMAARGSSASESSTAELSGAQGSAGAGSGGGE